MRVLVTGADQVLGKMLVEELNRKYTLNVLGRDDCDHRDPEALAKLCQNTDAIVHCDVFQGLGESEQASLDWAARGTYVLMQAALASGVGRVVLASTLSLFDSYPSQYVIDETWQPQPEPRAESLSPYLAELTCREFARQGGIHVSCVRLGNLGDAVGKMRDDVVGAFEAALDLKTEPSGYRWQVFHISSDPQFSSKHAQKVLGLSLEER